MPDDWTYIAEGGKHALFRYSGTDSGFTGHLLRIAKSELANAAGHDVTTNNDSRDASASLARTCKVIEFMEESASPAQVFHRRIVQPLLGHRYLDLARLVRLPESCCAELYNRTLEQVVIPQSRLPSWKIDGVKKSDGASESGFHQSVNATLLRDHTHLSPHPGISSASSSPSSVANNVIIGSKSNTVISVEIKPKAGYITASPFVLPDHRCKYYRTRYALQQELMQKGHVQKGWRRTQTGGDKQQSPTFNPSEYNPLDLFSGNIVQMQKALKDMSQNMQNNYRVFCNGRQMFGEYETPSKNDCQQILNDIFHYSETDERAQLPDPESTLLDVINSTVSTILDRESLLSNILSMQQLDVIDGDGAVAMYAQLVRLCEGEGTGWNDAGAEKILDDTALVPRDGLAIGQQASLHGIPPRWDSSPYPIPECDSLDKLLDEIVLLQSSLRNQRREESAPDEEFIDASREKCIEFANGLSKEACIYLLQNWLLSLSLCDVSFFVTFRLLTDQGQGVVDEEYQSCDHGGIATCSIPDGASASRTMSVQYELKVVDCDPKPAKKLRGRGEVESKFQFIKSS
jgi:hypothetical protein